MSMIIVLLSVMVVMVLGRGCELNTVKVVRKSDFRHFC